MKASLVWPAFEDFSGLDKTWIPHGVTQLATEANARGHIVDVLDGRVLGRDGMKAVLKTTNSRVIGISMISALVGFGKEIIRYLRENRTDMKIAIGGIHPTIAPDDFKFRKEFDWLIKGEGEITFPDILDGKVKIGIVDGIRPNLSELKPVNRTLIKIEEEPLPGLEKPFGTIIIGRGCKYHCTFCSPAERLLFGDHVRMRPIVDICYEIKNFKSVMVHDDCFTADPEYVDDFCNAIPPIKWWCQGRADNVVNNMQMVKKMRDHGLVGMILGHESGDDRVLRSIKKGVTVQQNVDAANILHALGVVVWSNIMVGLPYEPPSAVVNTIMMLRQIKPEITSVAVFTPHPGSKLYDECKDIMIRDKDDWTYFNRGDFRPKIEGPDYPFLAWAAGEMNRRE